MATRSLMPRSRSHAPVLSGDSLNPLMTFHDEMDRLFREFSRELDVPNFGLSSDFRFPHVELSETDKDIKVEAELPGLSENDVELLLKDDALIIRGEKKGRTEDKSRRVSERFYGRFERTIPLPSEVKEDQVNASFKSGVLTVTLPKSAESAEKTKRITIKTQ